MYFFYYKGYIFYTQIWLSDFKIRFKNSMGNTNQTFFIPVFKGAPHMPALKLSMPPTAYKQPPF